MSTGGLDPQYLAATAPSTSAEELQEIAWNRPDLWGVVLSHPNMYPELAQWIRTQSPAAPMQPQGTPTISQPQAMPTGSPPQAMPVSPQPQPKRSGSKVAVLGIVAGALALLLIIAGGVWWFVLRDGTSNKNSPTAFDVLPDRGVVVHLSSFGQNVQLVPIGPQSQASLRAGNNWVVAFVADGQWGLAGIDPSSTSSLPLWVLPIERSPAMYTVRGETIYLGGEEAFQIEGAVAKPAKQGSPSATTGGQQDEADETSGDTDGEPNSIGMSSQATDDVPYGVRNGFLVNEAGEEIVNLGDNGLPYYALRPSSKGAPWIISDGSSVAGVRGNDVLWIVTLPTGSAEVNGFGSDQGPSLSVAGVVVLVGQPDAIIALDTQSGEEVWRIETEVSSWSAGEDVLIVSDGTSIALMEFPRDGAGSEGGGTTIIGAQQDPLPDLSWEMFVNTALEVPESCVSTAGIRNIPVVFADGRGQVEGASVDINYLSSIVVEGQQYTAIAFTCARSGGDAVPSVGVYTEDMRLAADLDFAADLGVSAEDLVFDGLLGQGSAVQILLSSEKEGFCAECSPGSPAQVTMLWDGTEFVTTRLGDPSTIWDDPANMEEVQVGPRLTAEDLANITLYMPADVWRPYGDWEEYTFVDYASTKQLSFNDGNNQYFYTDTTYLSEEQAVEAAVDGEYYIFTSVDQSSDGPGGSFIGTLCAISMEQEVTCAELPSVGTSVAWVQDISVDGDLVTYDIYIGGSTPEVTLVQRFDGYSFTLVSQIF